MTILEHAMEFAAANIPVFPLNGKHPVIPSDEGGHGLYDASTDPECIRAMFSRDRVTGIGMPTGPKSGVFVVDVDPRNGGDQSLKLLEQEHGPLPETLRTESGRGDGGGHFFFQLPTNTTIKNNEQIAPGIDIKADGGYVVVPPSRHLEGKRQCYEWVSMAEPVAPPPWLLELAIAKEAPPPQQRKNGDAGTFGSEITEACRQWSADHPRTYPAKKPGECPVCHDTGSFKATPQSPDRWYCFSTDHPDGIGLRGKSGYHGDALDLEAFARSKDPVEVLLEDGYLRPRQKREDPPPLGDEDAPPPLGTVEDQSFHLTDLGNASRFVEAFGADLRYVFPWKRWLAWDGQRWAFDDGGRVARYAARVPQLIYAAAANCDDKDIREAMIEWGRKTEFAGRQAALVELARSHEKVVARPGDFDRDPMLMNVRNGTIDLKTCKLRPHRREDLLRRLAPVDFLPGAPCRLWLAFLETVLPGPAVRAFFQRAVGYSLTADINEHALFLLWGTGSNGKTVALERVQEILGDYGQSTKAETFMENRSEAIPNALAALDGARFVAISETDSGKRLAEGLVKDFTGGDTVAARFLFAEWFNFRPQFKLWIRTNHKPVIRGTDEGIWRRIKLIPFSVRIPEAERDHKLAERLAAELPGILRWAVEGCLAWQKNGLNPPIEVRAATNAYRDEMDPLGGWLADCCTVSEQVEETVKALFASYEAWCKSNGEDPLAKRPWGARLDDRGIVSDKGAKGVRIRLGVALTGGASTPPVAPDPDPLANIRTRANLPESGATLRHTPPTDVHAVGAGEQAELPESPRLGLGSTDMADSSDSVADSADNFPVNTPNSPSIPVNGEQGPQRPRSPQNGTPGGARDSETPARPVPGNAPPSDPPSQADWRSGLPNGTDERLKGWTTNDDVNDWDVL